MDRIPKKTLNLTDNYSYPDQYCRSIAFACVAFMAIKVRCQMLMEKPSTQISISPIRWLESGAMERWHLAWHVWAAGDTARA